MQLTLHIPSMACAACRDTITAAIQAVDPRAIVQADLGTKRLQVTTVAAEQQIRQAVERAGYPLGEA